MTTKLICHLLLATQVKFKSSYLIKDNILIKRSSAFMRSVVRANWDNETKMINRAVEVNFILLLDWMVVINVDKF